MIPLDLFPPYFCGAWQYPVTKWLLFLINVESDFHCLLFLFIFYSKQKTERNEGEWSPWYATPRQVLGHRLVVPRLYQPQINPFQPQRWVWYTGTTVPMGQEIITVGELTACLNAAMEMLAMICWHTADDSTRKARPNPFSVSEQSKT